MELRSPTIMSPTMGNGSNSDEPPKSTLTLYWPTRITIAKPHILSNSPTNSSSMGGGGIGAASSSADTNDSSEAAHQHRSGSKWLLGWNPRGLVVVVGAVLEVPTLSACQSVLEELHRDPPIGCDQSVIKYLRILGRLDFTEDSTGSNIESNTRGARPKRKVKSLSDEEDEIQTNRLKNTEDIWIELCTGARNGGRNSSSPATSPIVKGASGKQFPHHTAPAGPVHITDLHCCGYRQPVNLVTVRYDPGEQYPTGTCSATPLATVGAIMAQAVTKGSNAKVASLVLAPGAKSRLEGKYVDPIVRQLCAPPVTPTAPNAGSCSDAFASSPSPLNSTLKGPKEKSFDAKDLTPEKGARLRGYGDDHDEPSAAAAAGAEKSTDGASRRQHAAQGSSSVVGNGSFQAYLRGDDANSATRTPMLIPRNTSNDQISAMAAEMLDAATATGAGLGNGSFNKNSHNSPGSKDGTPKMTPHDTPSKNPYVNDSANTPSRGIKGHLAGIGSTASNATNSLYNANMGPQAAGSNGSFGANPHVLGGGIGGGNTLMETLQRTYYDSKSVVSAADAMTNDSFGSNHSFGGQVAGTSAANSGGVGVDGCIHGTNYNANTAPRLRYDTYESFTEFSVILKCCNTSARITSSLFDMEETLAEAETKVSSIRGDGSNASTSPSLGAAENANPSTAAHVGTLGHKKALSFDTPPQSAAPNPPRAAGDEGAAGNRSDVDVRVRLSMDTPAEGSILALGASAGVSGSANPTVLAVENSSLVSPQSSMKRRRREAEEEDNLRGSTAPSPIDSSAAHFNSSMKSGSGRSRSGVSAPAKGFKRLMLSAESIVVPFILNVLLPLLSVVREYSYVARLLEYRAMEVVNALSIVAGKSSACGLHPAVPHSLEGTTENQRFWCVARCFLQIGLDVFFGWSAMYWLAIFQDSFFAYIRPSAWYGLYDMHLGYLDWFEGWPGGFKMNDDLNVFISFFTRLSLDVWRWIVTFNEDWDWLAFSMLGLRFCFCFGLSFGLNFVSDCCNVATLHLRNTFHILRVVYVGFGSLIRSLTLQFRGKRVNPLRKRVDDYEFKNDQTVIGMLMCTCVLFLFPTLALHYLYLAIVRTSVWFVQECFCAIGFVVSNIPIASVMFWVLHRKEIVKSVAVTNINIDAATGSVEMTLKAQHMALGEAFVDWLTLIAIVTNPLQPQKLLSFIVSATLKPAINARHSVYPHLCANCVSPCLGSLAGQTSQSS